MNIETILRNRRSVREFKGKKISNDKLGQISDMINKLNSNLISGDLRYDLYENGKLLYEKLEDKGGYHGVMIESPHYIVIERANDKRDTVINSAYYAEQLITKLVDLGVDNCWISLGSVDEYLKRETFGEHAKIIEYVIGIGYGEEIGVYDGFKPRTRKGLEELVFDKNLDRPYDTVELEKRGLRDLFYYATHAPSDKNIQPWRFIIDENKVKLLAEYDEWNNSILIDIGIIMYYFEFLANKTGIVNKWEFISSNVFIKDGKKYTEIAEFKL